MGVSLAVPGDQDSPGVSSIAETGPKLQGAPTKFAATRKMVPVRSLARPVTNAVRIFADTLKAETAAMVRQGYWEGNLLFDGTQPK